LTSVHIGDGVTSIGKGAFRGCESLTTISIGNSITSIGEEAFEETAIYNDPSNWKNGALCIDSCLIKVSKYVPYAYTIRNDVRFIADKAFIECFSLTSVIIPNSVKSIGAGAFVDCYLLTSVSIPNSVTSIGEGAFADCESLPSITIPNSVTEIGGGAFYACKSLETIAFDGTMEQWHAIDKHYLWNYDTPATIIKCTDGEVEL
jgi:hypothetical protein